MLSGRAKLPDEATMIKEMEAFYDLRSSHKVPKRYTHCQVTCPCCSIAACCPMLLFDPCAKQGYRQCWCLGLCPVSLTVKWKLSVDTTLPLLPYQASKISHCELWSCAADSGHARDTVGVP